MFVFLFFFQFLAVAELYMYQCVDAEVSIKSLIKGKLTYWILIFILLNLT